MGDPCPKKAAQKILKLLGRKRRDDWFVRQKEISQIAVKRSMFQQNPG
jgi:hypothetical protein